MNSNPRNLPPLLRLPPETLDEIASYIDMHSDLMAFALASHACADLIIPQHSEYRIIRVRYKMASMWAHLARRADLARNIREVHICEKHNSTATDHFPTTLIEKSIDGVAENVEEGNRIRNLCEALRHMEHLRVFTWSWMPNVSAIVNPTTKPAHEDSIFIVLGQMASLRHLGLWGNFGAHAKAVYSDPRGQAFPLWKISNLQSLCLAGDVWIKPSNALHVCAMLKRSPGLQCLELPMEFTRLAECSFPELKKLKLPLQSGAVQTIDDSRARFIEKHSTIEDLFWHPIGTVSLSPQCLPALKRLSTNHQLMGILEDAAHPRFIECLDVQALDSHMFSRLKSLDRGSVRKLKLHRFGDLASVCELAELFPALTWLSMPTHTHAIAGPISPKLKDWLDILSRFPQLEVFRGAGLWAAVAMNKDRMHTAILELVQLCPKLRQLDHCEFHDKRHNWKRIVIIREGLDGENVRYEIQKPPPRNLFDVMDGIFD